MADVFPNLSDATVAAVVKNLAIYLPAPHLEGLLRVLDAVAGDVDSSLPEATTATVGGVKQAATQAPAAAADVAALKTQFDALLTKLKASGQMAS